MDELIKIILVILISSVKFLAGPPFAYYNNLYDFTFFQTVFYSVIGGMLGVISFTFFSKPIFEFGHWLRDSFRKFFRKPQTFSDPEPDFDNLDVKYIYLDKEQKKKDLNKRKHEKRIRLWNKYGLMGVAFLTPVILSIPIGTLLANSLENNRKKIILFMFVSVLFWSLLLTSLFEIFHAGNLRDLEEEIIK